MDKVLSPIFTLVNSKNQSVEIDRFFREATDCKVISVDTETTGLDPLLSRVRLLQIGLPESVWIFDCFDLDWDGHPEKVPTKLVALFKDPFVLKILHNAKFDWKMLKARLDIEIDSIFDSMIVSQLKAGGVRKVGHGLDKLLKRELDLELPKEMQRSDWSVRELSDEQILYAARDVSVLHPLRERLKTQLIEEDLVKVTKIEVFCTPALAQMELSGIKISSPRWKEIIRNLEAEKEELEEKLLPYFPAAQMDLFGDVKPGLNLNSPAQVKSVLEKFAGEELADASEKTLKKLAAQIPMAAWICEYRSCDKLLSTYGERFLQAIHTKTGRLHSDYFQIAAPSGRMACSQPNIQQIPKSHGFRHAVVPEEGGHYVIADYSQIELRIASAIADETVMIDAYQRGEDLHRLTASRVSGKPLEQVTPAMRQAAKAINFGFIFGMGSERFKSYSEEEYGIVMSSENAEAYRQKFFASYPNLKKWHKSAPENANRDRVIRTLCGRKVVIPEGEEWFSGALNIPVQGSAADGIKLAMGRLHRSKPLNSLGGKLVAMIHDELIFELPSHLKNEELLQVEEVISQEMISAMSEVVSQKVPIEVDTQIGDSWQDKK